MVVKHQQHEISLSHTHTQACVHAHTQTHTSIHTHNNHIFSRLSTSTFSSQECVRHELNQTAAHSLAVSHTQELEVTPPCRKAMDGLMISIMFIPLARVTQGQLSNEKCSLRSTFWRHPLAPMRAFFPVNHLLKFCALYLHRLFLFFNIYISSARQISVVIYHIFQTNWTHKCRSIH